MVEIESVVVKLGEKEYTIQQAGFLRSKPWKKRLFEEIKPLFERLSGASDIKFDSASDLFQLLPLAEDLFVNGIVTIYDLLIAYSPILEEDRQLIEAHATDKQILAAFQEVVKLSDPFGVVSQLNRRIGLKTTGISSN
jgi:hypothetical protein